MTLMIPYGRQDISEEDIQSVVNVLRSDFLTQGPVVPAFEKSLSDYCGSKYAVAVNSATSALHIACLALGVGKGDIVWTSPITFVASANCALYCGARIEFVDIDPRTYNMSVESLAEKLVFAEKAGNLPKVVIPVHLCGQPCDMAGIHALSQQYGFKIIEDASHAIGGKYRGEPIGNCQYSDITIFSFHPVKIITTGEGGMAMTKDVQLAKRMQLLRSHGITRDASEMTQEPDGPWYYQQIGLGYNYRLTDIQAALGISQMHRLDEFVEKRHAIAKRYNELLVDMPLTRPWQHQDSYSGFHLYVIRLTLGKMFKTHREVFEELRVAGIGVNLHYIPVYLQPYYSNLGFQVGLCPEAEKYYSEVISLPIYPALTEAQQNRVVAALHKAVTS
jgi:UDP-4-amino-4,6-dideoxy-N-acetyl-beta-L-altrosamine transaminase